MSGLQIFGMIFFIISMLVALAGAIFSVYRSVLLTKDKRQDPNYKKTMTHIIIGAGVFALGFAFAMPAIFIWNEYSATVLNYFQAILGGLFFAASIISLLDAFIIHFYKKGLPEKLDKALYITLLITIPLSVISMFVCTDGFINMGGYHFLFPKGLSFTEGFVRPDNDAKANITFYAVCILSGAIFVYFLGDHYCYKEYGKHNTLDLTFITAFPAGILGARIAYVIGNWTSEGFDKRVAAGEWWSIFAIWEGGLTILGGAIAGIIVGVLVYIKTNKGRSIWRAVDLLVPTILIAQAVGRWGNFFNCEVHGVLVDEASWKWLPGIIFNNAHYSSVNKWAPDGMLYVPLFFIEFLTNLLGYFVLSYGFGNKLKKILAPGDLCFGYIIWYGYTRIFMEPLRDTSFNMGEKGYWSWFWSIMFVLVGCLLIAINHLVRFILNNKKKVQYTFSSKTNLISMISVGVPALAFSIVGIVLMTTNEFAAKLAFNNFNIGVIFLVSGVSLLALMGVIVYQYFYNLKHPLELKNE